MKVYEIRILIFSFVVVLATVAVAIAVPIPDVTIIFVIGAFTCGTLVAGGYYFNELITSVNCIEATMTMFLMYLGLTMVSQYGLATVLGLYKMPVLIIGDMQISFLGLFGLLSIPKLIIYGWHMLCKANIKEGDLVEYVNDDAVRWQGEIHREKNLKKFFKFTINDNGTIREFPMSKIRYVKKI